MRIGFVAGAAGLWVAVAAGCGGGGATALSYGAASAPTALEASAADDAAASLAAGRTFSPSSEPTAGGPGLADQLAATLGAEGAPSAALPLPAARAPQVQQAVGRAVALATSPAAAVELPPGCVTITGAAGDPVGAVVWTGCSVEVPPTPPVASMTVRIDGRLDWNGATGTTSWSIRETLSTAIAADGGTVQVDAAVVLAGAFTSAAGATKGRSSTDVSVTTRLGGLSVREAFRTSLDADLTWETSPAFCIDGGTLTLEQVWTERPYGATAQDLPDQGWRFEWTGCGSFTVAHGQ